MVLFIAQLTVCFSQAQPYHGTYYHHTYFPKEYKSADYGSSPQNWGIAQDGRGLMYFCNSSGILEFDGIRWSMVPGTENLDMNKAVCGADGRIFTGGASEIGYLGRRNGSGIQFISLKPLIPDSLQDFGDILMVKALGDSIAFLSPKHLFIYHHDIVSVISTADRYQRLFNFNGHLIVQLADAGLVELVGNDLVPWHQNKMPSSRIIRHMLGPISKPILACNRSGFLEIDQGNLRYRPSGLDTLTLWNGDGLNHRIHAIGSTEKGALIVDDQGQLKDVFHTEYDLTGYSVVSPFFDQNSRLWLATSNGIRHIEYPSQLSYIDEDSGIRGIPLCLDESDQGIMIGTTEGLFIQNKPTRRFKKVTIEDEKRTDEFVTDILNVQNDTLILTSYGLFLKKRDRYKRITDVGGFDLAIIDSAEAKIVFGGEEGMVFVSKTDGTWHPVLTIDTLSHGILSVTPQGDSTVWASMFSISRIDLTPHGAQVTTLDSLHGFVPEMGPVWTFLRHDKVYFCTAVGLYAWNEAKQRLEPDDLLGADFSKGAMSYPVVMGDHAVWVSHVQGIGPYDLNTKQFLDRNLRRIDYSDVWRIQPSPEGHVWIMTTEAVVRYDPSVDANYQDGFHAIIREVTTKGDSILFAGFFNTGNGAPTGVQPDSMRPVLRYRYNQVSIKYAATYYDAEDKIMYSTFLDGQDEEWSPWSAQPFKDYMNLREGHYTFQVRARNVYGVEGSIATYSFSVRPPWYRSNWAYLFYLICAVLGVWGIAVLYSLRLRRQKIQLEGIVIDRTREIAEEKEKSDNLLLNILPEETATELKTQGFATTRSYDKVSVLFTDFVSFSSISESMSPEDLVREIDECFSAFDEILEQEGVEKIKTIGDSYMCASGLNHTADHPEIRIVRVGLAIRDFMEARNALRIEQGLPHFQIRIGIHTGPVVAGVVGKKKFAYDIWGDTVNTASRMESNSEPGELNISASTYAMIREAFVCEYRGMIEAKNKGKLDMYFVRRMVSGESERDMN